MTGQGTILLQSHVLQTQENTDKVESAHQERGVWERTNNSLHKLTAKTVMAGEVDRNGTQGDQVKKPFSNNRSEPDRFGWPSLGATYLFTLIHKKGVLYS